MGIHYKLSVQFENIFDEVYKLDLIFHISPKLFKTQLHSPSFLFKQRDHQRELANSGIGDIIAIDINK